MIERGNGESTTKNTGTVVGLAAMTYSTDFFSDRLEKGPGAKNLDFFVDHKLRQL